MSRRSDTTENQEFSGNISIVPNVNLADGDGSLEVYGSVFTDTILPNTINGSVNLQNTLFNDTISSTSNSTGSIIVPGGIGITDTTDATSSINGGSITTAGGVAIEKKLFVGSDISSGGKLTVGGTITSNGPGTTSSSTSTFYINPSITNVSGSNNYFYTFFATPQTSGSTSGSASTLFIQGPPANTLDAYSLFVGTGATFLGGRLFIATTSDTPAINPDAFNTLIIYENQTQATVYSGVLGGSSIYLQNNYIQLTTTSVPNYGQIYWRRHPGNAFSSIFEIFNGNSSIGNGITFYWHSTTIPDSISNYNTGITNGYSLIFDDSISLWYNGNQLITIPSILIDNEFNKVSIIFIRDTIRVFINGILAINYQDTINRSPTNLNAFIGFTGYNVVSGDFHRIRNIRISKTNEGLLSYTSPASNNMTINATNVGIGNSSPIYPLDVSGEARVINLLTSNIDISGASSGTISIKPQSNSGTYNFNLPVSSGTSGQVLTSTGGINSPMTWTTINSTNTINQIKLISLSLNKQNVIMNLPVSSSIFVLSPLIITGASANFISNKNSANSSYNITILNANPSINNDSNLIPTYPNYNGFILSIDNTDNDGMYELLDNSNFNYTIFTLNNTDIYNYNSNTTGCYFLSIYNYISGPFATVLICKSDSSINSVAINILSSSPGVSPFTQLNFTWSASGSIGINKTTNSYNGDYYIRDNFQNTSFQSTISLSGTSSTFIPASVFPYYTQKSFFVSVIGSSSGSPNAIFSVSKNDNLLNGNVYTICSPGAGSLEQLNLTWNVNSLLSLNKTGVNYNGNYTLTFTQLS